MQSAKRHPAKNSALFAKEQRFYKKKSICFTGKWIFFQQHIFLSQELFFRSAKF
jgi:hypothetical protein